MRADASFEKRAVRIIARNEVGVSRPVSVRLLVGWCSLLSEQVPSFVCPTMADENLDSPWEAARCCHCCPYYTTTTAVAAICTGNHAAADAAVAAATHATTADATVNTAAYATNEAAAAAYAAVAHVCVVSDSSR